MECGYNEPAVVTASELSSSYFRKEHPESGVSTHLRTKEELGLHDKDLFDLDFLWWMMCDGTVALYLPSKPNPEKSSQASHSTSGLETERQSDH